MECHPTDSEASLDKILENSLTAFSMIRSKDMTTRMNYLDDIKLADMGYITITQRNYFATYINKSYKKPEQFAVVL